MCQRTKYDVRSPIQSWSAYKDDAGIGDTALCHYVTINIINTSTPDSDNNIYRGKITISQNQNCGADIDGLRSKKNPTRRSCVLRSMRIKENAQRIVHNWSLNSKTQHHTASVLRMSAGGWSMRRPHHWVIDRKPYFCEDTHLFRGAICVRLAASDGCA